MGEKTLVFHNLDVISRCEAAGIFFITKYCVFLYQITSEEKMHVK